MAQDNTNRGALWKNDDKQSDNHPDFKGSLNVDGVEFWVAGWKRKPDANPKAPALSFTVTMKEGQDSPKPNARQPSRTQPEPNQSSDFEEEIPW